jgi:hypothetical protein
MCDYPSVFSNKLVKGKKDYRCCECSKAIAISEKHYSIFGVWDNHPRSYRVCSDCENVRKLLIEYFGKNEDCVGLYTNLHEELINYDLVVYDPDEDNVILELDDRLEKILSDGRWRFIVKEVEFAKTL